MRSSLPSRLPRSWALPRAAVLVVGAAAVAGADVHELVGTEGEQAAVVVGLHAVVAQDEPRAAGVGAVGAGLRAAVLDDALRAALVGVVDVEAARLGVVGRERDRQQALLAAADHLAAHVEERARQPLAGAHDADRAALLDDEDAARVAGRRGDVQRRVEAADVDELHAVGGRRLGGGRRSAASPVAAGAGLRRAVVRAAGGEHDERGEQRERDGGALHPIEHATPRAAGGAVACAP